MTARARVYVSEKMPGSILRRSYRVDVVSLQASLDPCPERRQVQRSARTAARLTPHFHLESWTTVMQVNVDIRKCALEIDCC